MVYAGFWRRLGAQVIDNCIITLIAFGLALLLAVTIGAALADEIPAPPKLVHESPSTAAIIDGMKAGIKENADAPHQRSFEEGDEDTDKGDKAAINMAVGAFWVVSQIFIILVSMVYNTVFIASKWQATPGKRLVGVMVVTRDGQRLDWGHSFGRMIARSLNIFTLYIGYMMIGWTKQKTGLHDLIASTRVIRGEAK